jgi:hypothetical protein
MKHPLTDKTRRLQEEGGDRTLSEAHACPCSILEHAQERHLQVAKPLGFVHEQAEWR